MTTRCAKTGCVERIYKSGLCSDHWTEHELNDPIYLRRIVLGINFDQPLSARENEVMTRLGVGMDQTMPLSLAKEAALNKISEIKERRWS